MSASFLAAAAERAAVAKPATAERLSPKKHRAERRLAKERGHLLTAGYDVSDVSDLSDRLTWHVTVQFRQLGERLVEVCFPMDYPCAPPAVRFLPPVPQHPKITDDGYITPYGGKLTEDGVVRAAMRGTTEPVIVYMSTVSAELFSFKLPLDSNVAHLLVLIRDAIPGGAIIAFRDNMVFCGKPLSSPTNVTKTLLELGVREESKIAICSSHSHLLRPATNFPAGRHGEWVWRPALMVLRVLEGARDFVDDLENLRCF